MSIDISCLKRIFTGKEYYVGFPNTENDFVEAVEQTINFQKYVVENAEVISKTFISVSDICISALSIEDTENGDVIGLDFITSQKFNKLLWEEDFSRYNASITLPQGLEKIRIPEFPVVKLAWEKVISDSGCRGFHLSRFLCEYDSKPFIVLKPDEKRHIVQFVGDPDKKSIYINDIVDYNERVKFEERLTSMVEMFLTDQLLQIGWSGTEEFTL